MSILYIASSNLPLLLGRLIKTATVIAPVIYKELSRLEQVTADNLNAVYLGGYRPVDAYKSYFFRAEETAAAYFNETNEAPGQPLILLGLKSCDVEALKIYDRVLGEGDDRDNCFQKNRAATLIISADCGATGPACFCTMVKGQPFPQNGYDLNFSPLPEGFLVEVGGQAGQELVDKNKEFFRDALPAEIADREKNRQVLLEKVNENNQEYLTNCNIGWTEVHRLNLENKKGWRKVTKDCVECSSCNFGCPSCTCFLLLDRGKDGEYTKEKVWDACLKNGYARTAGGGNSRPKLFERLQNRYHCKFDYSFERLGRYTCVGCGRCIDGCAGKIDMRKVYLELVKQAPLTAKLA